jgi:hypothetical protein
MFLIITVVLSSLEELNFPSSDSLKRNRDSLLFPFQPFLFGCCFDDDDDAPDEYGEVLLFPLLPAPIEEVVAAATTVWAALIFLIVLLLLAQVVESAPLVLFGSVGLTVLVLRRIATGAFWVGTYCGVDGRNLGGVGKLGL